MAGEPGAEGARLAERATAAFTDSLTLTSGAGAALMPAGTLLVWPLTPRDLDLSSAHHQGAGDRGGRRGCG
ncbi:hypothetical protein ACTMTI_29750 [Nonomuraea sp. H19]|uniref:hypothetical protein n=1 Tax=Nonomuraea sp. H19 TaxID=3452206 RepID=UPI003F8A6C15